MRAFSRVAELGSFTRAADELGLSRAMVSTHVQPAGEAVWPAAAQPHDPQSRADAGRRRIPRALPAHLRRTHRRGGNASPQQEQPTGRLCVDVPGSFGRHILLPALPEFLQRYPGIDLDLRINERVADLAREGVDLAVRAGTVTDPDLVALPGFGLALDHLRLAALPRPPRTPADPRGSGRPCADRLDPPGWHASAAVAVRQ